jgi:mercuric ion transport protein
MKVELLYERDCPNVRPTRENLRRALTSVGVSSSWTEWEQSAPNAPRYVQSFGSPTVLVNGRDVAGIEAERERSCCRLYQSADGTSGVPSVELITAALAAAVSTTKHRPVRHYLLALPGIVVSAAPFGGCPACWPVYAGVLSVLGLGVLLSREYLVPLTVLFLAVAVLSLARRARERRGFGPLLLGILASVLIMTGKFSIESAVTAYLGVGLLVLSSVWNAWPRPAGASCPKCTPSGGELIQLSAGEK